MLPPTAHLQTRSLSHWTMRAITRSNLRDVTPAKTKVVYVYVTFDCAACGGRQPLVEGRKVLLNLLVIGANLPARVRGGCNRLRHRLLYRPIESSLFSGGHCLCGRQLDRRSSADDLQTALVAHTQLLQLHMCART